MVSYFNCHIKGGDYRSITWPQRKDRHLNDMSEPWSYDNKLKPEGNAGPTALKNKQVLVIDHF